MRRVIVCSRSFRFCPLVDLIPCGWRRSLFYCHSLQCAYCVIYTKCVYWLVTSVWCFNLLTVYCHSLPHPSLLEMFFR